MRGRGAEERHHRVPDELLDRPAVTLELGTDALVIRPQERLDVLGVHRLGACREADEVAEDDRYDLPLTASGAHAVASRWRTRSPRSTNSDAPIER